jgi:hypothetical protein
MIQGEVTDDGIVRLRVLLSDQFGVDFGEKTTRDAVRSLALEQCFDPVRDAAQVHEKVVAVIHHVHHERLHLLVADLICRVHVLKLFRVPEAIVRHELGEALSYGRVVLAA